jgi:predicted site-specific integrase-resolvase
MEPTATVWSAPSDMAAAVSRRSIAAASRASISFWITGATTSGIVDTQSESLSKSNSTRQGLLIGYARTSTADREAGLQDQVRDPKAAGRAKIFRERVSSIAERAQLQRAF